MAHLHRGIGHVEFVATGKHVQGSRQEDRGVRDRVPRPFTQAEVLVTPEAILVERPIKVAEVRCAHVRQYTVPSEQR